MFIGKFFKNLISYHIFVFPDMPVMPDNSSKFCPDFLSYKISSPSYARQKIILTFNKF